MKTLTVVVLTTNHADQRLNVVSFTSSWVLERVWSTSQGPCTLVLRCVAVAVAAALCACCVCVCHVLCES